MCISCPGAARERTFVMDIQVIEDLLTKGTTAKPFGQSLPSGIGVAEKKNTAKS